MVASVDNADAPVESDGPDRLKRAQQVLDGAYEQARASDYRPDTAAMRVLGRAEQGYQQAKQDEAYDHPPDTAYIAQRPDVEPVAVS